MSEDIIGKVGDSVFMLAVDAVVCIDGKILLLRRTSEPHRGKWVLPGGRVRMDELLESAVLREVEEETGVHCKVKRLVGVYDAPDRDPRGRAVSVCFLCECDARSLCKVKTPEAEEIKLFEPGQLPRLGFDHEQMVRDALGL
jgi:8-oxo-dGTP diphosphatase